MNSTIKDRIRLVLGVAICFALAGVALLVEHLIPGQILGASILALFAAFSHWPS